MKQGSLRIATWIYRRYSNLDIQAGPMMVEAGLALTRQMKPGKPPEWASAPPFKAAPWEYGTVPPELD